MSCFWVFFGLSSIVLWLIFAFWTVLFVIFGRLCLNNLGAVRGGLLLPFRSTGLEYFRSELYYLRFSWLNIGYAFSASAYRPALNFLGMYGIGFFAVTVAAAIWLPGLKR